MKPIISVSRRTDIPAYYGEWFMHRIEEGCVGVINPFGGQKNLISLKKNEVFGLVFWSKNYAPFLVSLEKLKNLEYPLYCNFTFTNLPKELENNRLDLNEAIDLVQTLSALLSPHHINWRYDPIVISNKTNADFHIDNFKLLCDRLQGKVFRCYISFVCHYNKIKKNITLLSHKNQWLIYDPPEKEKVELALELSRIAKQYHLELYACCSPYLIVDRIKQAHCIDGEIFQKLYQWPISTSWKIKPTRKGCACTQSTDIGVYDTCPHGCIYCYANKNKELAIQRYKQLDLNSAFLGYSKSQSDEWITDILDRQKKDKQLSLPLANVD